MQLNEGAVIGTSDAARLVDEHMRDHLTDGHWHDRCIYCLDRRQHGGTGVPEGELIAYEYRVQQRHETQMAAAKRWESSRGPAWRKQQCRP